MEETAVVLHEMLSEELEIPELSAQNTAHVMRYIGAVNRLREKKEEFKQQYAEVQEFYTRKQTQIDQAIQQVTGAIEAYLNYHTTSSIATPRGTAFISNRDNVEWDEVLALNWALAHEGEHPQLVRIKKELNKAEYRKLYESGIQVPGIAIHKETSTVIKKA